MLIQFKVKNFGSFRDEAVLDMRAVKAYKEHPYNLIQESEKSQLIKVAPIYGSLTDLHPNSSSISEVLKFSIMEVPIIIAS